jgi:hypothetical protein
MNSTIHTIHERSINIPIKQNLTTSFKGKSPKSEYSLKQHFFDPTKSSPPNDFMIKLQKRMSVYVTVFYSDINDDSRESE